MLDSTTAAEVAAPLQKEAGVKKPAPVSLSRVFAEYTVGDWGKAFKKEVKDCYRFFWLLCTPARSNALSSLSPGPSTVLSIKSQIANLLRDMRRRALHCHLDARRPDIIARSSGHGANTAGPDPEISRAGAPALRAARCAVSRCGQR